MNPLHPGRNAPNRGVTIHTQWTNAVFENFHELPLHDKSHLGAWCYTDKLSYQPGDTLRIHTCTTGVRYDIRIYRDGAVETEVFAKLAMPGVFHPTPKDCSVNGCGWPVALEFTVPPWRSGGYIIHICGYDDNGNHIDHHFPVALRAVSPSAPDAVLLVTCTGTWMAYNDWGGSNHYEGIEGEHEDEAAPVVSTLRPFSRGIAWLPEGAPRITLSEPPKMGAAIRYPHMEWAYANGFSKKYASAGWATYERHFARWAESQGFTVDVATQYDLQLMPRLLDRYPCIVLVGHDEYWSAEMRDTVENFVEGGGHVARFAGNFGWQIRVEDGGTKQICYKTDAPAKDPVRDTDRKHLLTSSWEDADIARPGTLTFGLNGSSGIYAGWGGCVPRGSGGFTVYRPEHWAFEGTDLYYGDQLGAASKVFGYEVDGCDYTFRNGLPYPTGDDGAPMDMEIIAMNVATTFEADHGNAGSTLFIGDADSKAVAFQKLRRTDEAAIESVKRGSGMIVSFERGRGSIFNAATCEWVAGLVARDPFVEKVTANVLNRFIGRSSKS
ncbi:N,N-dimethylformamidase beta subunit family domain-containing protein [Mesorhizobium carmichaelinearum]|uniref:N,N-dimethylformamidase beta subunit family domain-containing protein n=1 Tax=Mesorhizobium carmichaelinearum TaxID=1208188 RepID=UPI001FCEABA7|nr:N,N-dimethylformamidase beta subunit family domain-containing protein [Mesorhizobium carmichaelinearum]